MIGIVVNSGVAVKIAKLIGTSGEGSLFIALLIAALGCLLLGMALPTVAAYLIAVTLFASAIQGLGISALVTNMFIFYFGVVAQITPPVCLASFTAAGIAGASAWKTGWKAFSFAITAFIVPFAFVYRPAILLEGTMVEIIIAYCIVIAATYLLACGIAGYLFRPLKMWERTQTVRSTKSTAGRQNTSARSRSTGTKQSRGTASRSKKQQTGGESRVALGIILAALVLGLIARAISMGLV